MKEIVQYLVELERAKDSAKKDMDFRISGVLNIQIQTVYKVLEMLKYEV
jgi:hypothetical protein